MNRLFLCFVSFMENVRPIILITNDDSVYAKGIHELIEVARNLGDVVVVAPDRVRSGMSSALTHSEPLRLIPVREEDHCKVYACTGTPVDCMKLAFYRLFAERQPDLVLSGINHGSNASVNCLYSATVGAAMEGCVNNVPSIAFSLCDHDAEADFSYCLPFVEKVISSVLQHSLPHATFLNVNFPTGEMAGMKVCRQADARWSEEYNVVKGENGEEQFQLAGYFDNRETESDDTDGWALDHHYGSIVPTTIDMTNYRVLNQMKEMYER